MTNLFAILFLILGIASQFLLTMQKFTAGIQGIVCLLISIVFCLYSARSHGADVKQQRESLIIAFIAATMIIVHAVQLPANYDIQKKYDRIIENARLVEARNVEEPPIAE